ncbi:MAG: hypothetical protein ABJB12_23130 [Pseudomonadota bacterium]
MRALSRTAVIFAVFVVLGAVAFLASAPHPRVAAWTHRGAAPNGAPRTLASSLSASTPAPGTLPDPLNPGHPMLVDVIARPEPGDWVAARPAFQYSRTAAERGGVEPCATQAPDSSAFDAWAPLNRGRFIAPRENALDATGHFDLVIHLNGDEPVRRELIASQQRFVLYSLTVADQGYAHLVTGTHLVESVVRGLEQALTKRDGKLALVGHIALSAWSAGFVGVEAALAAPSSQSVDAVLLIDGLHAPRNDATAFKAQLQPFVDYAQRAAKGERFFFVSHSSIDPPDFASTTESAHYLVASLGGRPQAVRRNDAFGLELVETFDRGDFHVRGYAGNDKADHCAQLALLRDAFGALGRRWASPAAPPH